MAITTTVEKDRRPQAARRRRKKRRTEDFSDSSDSSSSDSSGDEGEIEAEREAKSQEEDVNVDYDGDVVLDEEDIKISEKFEDVKEKLKTVKLTKTALNERGKNFNSVEVEKTLTRNLKQLENDYLGLMFENYGDDMDKLRTAPDFNERSLGILANVLKNGGHIFDEATLTAIVKK